MCMTEAGKGGCFVYADFADSKLSSIFSHGRKMRAEMQYVSIFGDNFQISTNGNAMGVNYV